MVIEHTADRSLQNSKLSHRWSCVSEKKTSFLHVDTKKHNSCHAVPEERKLWKAWTIPALQKSPSRRRCFVSSSVLSFSLMDFLNSACQNTSEVLLIALWWCGENKPSSMLCKSRFKLAAGNLSWSLVCLFCSFLRSARVFWSTGRALWSEREYEHGRGAWCNLRYSHGLRE